MTKTLSYVIETAERGFYDNTNSNIIIKSMNNIVNTKLEEIQKACSLDLVVAFGFVLGPFDIDCRNTYKMTYADIIALLLEYPKSKNKEEFFAKYEEVLTTFIHIAMSFRELSKSNEYAETIYNTQIKALYECLENSGNSKSLKFRYNQLLQYAKDKLGYHITDKTTVKSLCAFISNQQLTESTLDNKLSIRGKQFVQIYKFIFGDLFSAAFPQYFNVTDILNKYPDFDCDADEDYFNYHLEQFRISNNRF